MNYRPAKILWAYWDEVINMEWDALKFEPILIEVA
jgi:hypothetical protein